MRRTTLMVAGLLGLTCLAYAGCKQLVVVHEQRVVEQPVYVEQAPPAPIVERMPPPPHPNYVWVPGHYVYEGNHYVWVQGHYASPPRRNAHWVADRWVEDQEHHRWRHEKGHWE